MLPDPEIHDYDLEAPAYMLDTYAGTPQSPTTVLRRRLQHVAYILVLLLMLVALVVFAHFNSQRELGAKGTSHIATAPVMDYQPPSQSTPTFVAPYPTAPGLEAEIKQLLGHPVANPRVAPVLGPRIVTILAFMDPGKTPGYHEAGLVDSCQIETNGQLTEVGIDDVTGYALVYYSPPANKTSFGISCDGSSDQSTLESVPLSAIMQAVRWPKCGVAGADGGVREMRAVQDAFRAARFRRRNSFM